MYNSLSQPLSSSNGDASLTIICLLLGIGVFACSMLVIDRKDLVEDWVTLRKIFATQRATH